MFALSIEEVSIFVRVIFPDQISVTINNTYEIYLLRFAYEISLKSKINLANSTFERTSQNAIMKMQSFVEFSHPLLRFALSSLESTT